MSFSFRKTRRDARVRPIRRTSPLRLETLEARCLLATFRNGGGGDYNWNNPLNWSTGQLPGATDDVTINVAGDVTIAAASGAIHSLASQDAITIEGGTLDIAAASSIRALTMTSGLLTGTGDVDVTGAFLWKGGTLSGNSTLTAQGGIELQQTGNFNNDWQLVGRTLVNEGDGRVTGQFPQSSARLFFREGAEFLNRGSFRIENQVGAIFDRLDAAPAAFVNQGLFTQATAGATTFGGVAFHNSGTVDVQAGGDLRLEGGGQSSGAFRAAAGTFLRLGGGQALDQTSSIASLGEVQFTGATVAGSLRAAATTVYGGPLDFTGQVLDVGHRLWVFAASADFHATAIEVADLEVQGTLTSGPLTVTHEFVWIGGSRLAGTGSATVAAGATPELRQTGNFNNDWQLVGRTLVNEGDGRVTGQFPQSSARLFFREGAEFLNRGSFRIENQVGAIFDRLDAAPAAFVNQGLFTQATAGVTTFGGVAFHNSGTGEARTGELSFQSYTQTAGTTLLDGGVISAPVLKIQGGSLTGAGTINASVTNSGQLVPGRYGAMGTLTINGSYTQTAAGSVTVKIGSGGSDLLAVSGSAALGGSLDIADLTSAALPLGTTFTVMIFPSSTGAFAAYNGLGIKNSEIITPTLNPTSLTLTVQADHAPVVGPTSGAGNTITPTVPVNLSAPFTDQDTFETHTAIWNWGDGNNTTGTLTESPGSGSVTGSHAYAHPGTYTVLLTVTDSDGASGSASTTVVVPKVADTTRVTPSATTPLFGVDSVTFTATVAAAVPGFGSPTGSVQFAVDGTNVGAPVPLVAGGTASFTTSTLAVGGHTVTATYGGDATFQNGVGSTSVNVIPPASLSGVVFSDFNDDGQVDFGEKGIAGVPITLTGTDDLGHSVSLSQTTDSAGAYVFLNLRPGTYTITETQQPAGYTPGIATIGTGGGTVSGAQFTVTLTVGVNAMNYNYGERPAATGPIQHGQTAGIGFWNNKNGQALIKALNGGVGTELGDWLAATFPHMFGASSGSNNLAGKNNAYVASFFQGRFVVKDQKLDAQVLATALAVYVTDPILDNTGVGTQYGFTVSGNGVATATYNVKANGAAFGVADNTTMTVMDMLLAADSQAVNGVLYNGDTAKRNKANNVFSGINQVGSI